MSRDVQCCFLFAIISGVSPGFFCGEPASHHTDHRRGPGLRDHCPFRPEGCRRIPSWPPLGPHSLSRNCGRRNRVVDGNVPNDRGWRSIFPESLPHSFLAKYFPALQEVMSSCISRSPGCVLPRQHHTRTISSGVPVPLAIGIRRSKCDI